MATRLVRLLAALLMPVLLAAAPAQAKRVALVVGNDTYQSLPPLQKAVNDARAVKGALTELGFVVIDGENLTRREMNRRLAELEKSISPGDQVFVFYAGHGIAIGAENYLLPVDMPMPQGGEEALVRTEGHPADAIIRGIQAKGAATTFVVLDACRNNPVADRGTRDVGYERGLARMDAPAGVFVLFSAGIGQTALDRLSPNEADPNSVFTRKLVPLLRKPGLSHVDLAKELQQEVSALAATIKHRQEPAYYDQIIGRVVLKEAAPVALLAPSTSPPATSAPPAPASTEAERAWAVVKDSTDPEAFEAFLKRYRDSFYGDLAAARLAALKRQQQQAMLPAPAAPEPEAPVTMQPGTVFRDCADCPEMVVVPAGSFMMGSSASELAALTKEHGDHFRDEGPQHRVAIGRPFAAGKVEATRDEFEAFVKATGHEVGNECFMWTGQDWVKSSGSFRRPSFKQLGSHPATCINWNDAKAYVAWLTKKSGKSYRLLTEAEWEYAARAGTSTRHHFGNDSDEMCAYGNGIDQSARAKFADGLAFNCSDGHVYTAPVGSFRPNAFGLHDTLGNVCEWVEDCYQDSYNGAASDGHIAASAGNCRDRIMRGGSWVNVPRNLRVTDRLQMKAENRYFNAGLRVARSLP